MKFLRLCIGLSASLFSVSLLAQSAETMQMSADSPGAMADVRTIRAKATVVGIDKQSREITIKRENGETASITAGDEMRNFDQIKVGDVVTAEVTQMLSLELKKGGGASSEPTDDSRVATRAPGEKPGAVVSEAVTVMADVVAVDPQAKMVSVRGPEGGVFELPVADPERLASIQKGDQIQAQYAESVAVTVDAAPTATGSSGN